MVDKLWRVQIDVFDCNLYGTLRMYWYSEKRTEEEAKIEALEEFIKSTWKIVEVYKPIRISLDISRGNEVDCYMNYLFMVKRLLKAYKIMYNKNTPNIKLLKLINNRMTEMWLRK